MAQKPSIPKGTRDFNAVDIAKRNYIINVITTHFKQFGFEPIETPSFENSETLLGKYGEEGDRLIFKILNSGSYLNKVTDATYQQKSEAVLTPKISQKALRYDLTVPFARYVVQHQNDIEFPFKRYQIQPVWRADRPQKGRFREFYQCDADVVGSKSLLQEVEFIQLYDAVFSALKLSGITIKINNRKILTGIAKVIGAQQNITNFTVALDKLEKIGKNKVKEEMLQKGISEESILKLEPLFQLEGTIENQLDTLKIILKNSELGLQGIEEVSYIITVINQLGLKAAALQFDVTLARGLNYYTGAIFEVNAPNQINIGSIGGGGRYDDLTGIFGLANLSGIGVSFGLDRIFMVLDQLNLFPKQISETTKVLFLNFGNSEAIKCLKAITQLRQAGIITELYPDASKIKKQLNYANKRGIPYVVMVGEAELKLNKFSLKNMKTGEQDILDILELIAHLKS